MVQSFASGKLVDSPVIDFCRWYIHYGNFGDVLNNYGECKHHSFGRNKILQFFQVYFL